MYFVSDITCKYVFKEYKARNFKYNFLSTFQLYIRLQYNTQHSKNTPDEINTRIPKHSAKRFSSKNFTQRLIQRRIQVRISKKISKLFDTHLELFSEATFSNELPLVTRLQILQLLSY